MVTMTVVALATKIIAFGSVGIGLSSVMRLFHNYEWKPTNKKEVNGDAGEFLREKSKRIS